MVEWWNVLYMSVYMRKKIVYMCTKMFAYLFVCLHMFVYIRRKMAIKYFLYFLVLIKYIIL